VSHSLRRRRLGAIMATALLASCVSISPATVRSEPPADLGTATGKTLFAIYLMGSDLEGKGPDESVPGGNPGNGTYNLMQLIKGYESLSEAEKANVDVLVALGGSKRPGWEGMKVADLPALIADAKDGKFGNGSGYLSNEPSSNMGDPNVLQAFMSRVKQRAADTGSTRTFMSFWDHGGAFGGFGQQGDPGEMNVPQIAGAFAKSGLKADLIGFDACLMANLEVAAVLKPYGRYLVASEELEPGRGWNYTPIIQTMGKGDKATTVAIGKAVVDSLIDTAEYAEMSGKTLSVLDLAKLGPIETALGSVSQTLSGGIATVTRPMLKAATKSRSYGGSKVESWVSVDLVDYARQLKSRHQPVSAQLDQLIGAVQSAVVYNREDGTRPNSFGLSIAALANPGNFNPATYNPDTAPLPTWLNLVTNVISQARADTTPPKIVDVKAAQQAGRDGQSLQVVEDFGVRSVVGVHAVLGAKGLPAAVAGDRLAFVLTTPAAILDEASDTYFVPNWDGKAFVADFGGGEVILPVAYTGPGPDGTELFSAEVMWNGQKAEADIGWNPATQSGAIYAVRPYVTYHNVEVPSRLQEQLQAGDTLAFYYLTVDTKTEKESYELAPAVTVSGGEHPIRQVAVTGSAFTFGAVEDLKGNVDITTPKAITL
jgi:hypothetical protein